MGLSASMWTSVSGLISHGNKMNVVGNNIANVSTIGFKSQRMDFNDYLYISGGSTSGPVQIGAGVNTYAVIGDFSQGTLESTNSVTDIGIDGEGFFKVRKPNTEQMYYTRAGDFFFNADRVLQNPEGYRLQGWKINNSSTLSFKSDSVNLGKDTANESAFQGTGTPVDIVLDSWYLEPQRTSSVNFTMGLTSDGKSDRSTSTKSPMTALFDQWDATKKPPMSDSSYATSSTIKVYDEGGTAHNLTVYYDQVATQAKDADGALIYNIEGLPAGYTMYEYVVTVPPEEDMRSYGGKGFDQESNEFKGDPPTSFYNDPIKGTNKMAGMMMAGHLIFDAAGNLVNQTAYTYGATADPDNMDQCNQDPAALSSWQATKFSSNGLPVFCANFTGQPLANSVSEKLSATQSQAQDYLIELDLGLRTAADWSYAGSLEDLKGRMVDPITNNETRINLGSKTVQETVKWSPILNAENKPTDRYAWQGDGSDENGNQAVSATYGEDPTISIKLTTDVNEYKYYEIQIDGKGPKTMWVDPETRKETKADASDAVLCYVGENGKPVMQDDKLLIIARNKLDNGKVVHVGIDGTTQLSDDELAEKILSPANAWLDGDTKAQADAVFTMEESVRIIPKNVMNGDYEKVVAGSDDPQPVELERDAYALVNDAKHFVFYNEAGVVQGISKKPISYWLSQTGVDGDLQKAHDAAEAAAGKKPDAADYDDKTDGMGEYDNYPIMFPKATASRVIDYNKDVSTYDDPIRAENASKAGGSSFVTQDAGQNGYASGVLSGTNITADGVVYGYYDNGETVPLYQIALYDFHNKQGLRREGGNLYGQTKESGEARQGVAGENGFGNTKAYNIEGSNVDLSREFVNMITTQRGFQANSKGITTVDTMLETVIGMKR